MKTCVWVQPVVTGEVILIQFRSKDKGKCVKLSTRFNGEVTVLHRRCQVGCQSISHLVRFQLLAPPLLLRPWNPFPGSCGHLERCHSQRTVTWPYYTQITWVLSEPRDSMKLTADVTLHIMFICWRSQRYASAVKPVESTDVVII